MRPYTSRDLCRVLLGCLCMARLAACGFGLFLSSPLLSVQTKPPVCDGPPPPTCNTITVQHRSLTTDANANANADRNDQCQTQNHTDAWATSRKALRDPGCCVVSVCSPGNTNSNVSVNVIDDNEYKNDSLDAHLAVLQDQLADRGPSDIDIRARIDTTTFDSAMKDCLKVCRSSMAETTGRNLGEIDELKNCNNDGDGDDDDDSASPCMVAPATALAEFAMGMASFADDCCGCDTNDTDNTNATTTEYSSVFLRIVCASSYKAHDPVFHTDKAPLRGYATLRGVGTEFVTHPCSPLEYLALRSLGTKLPRYNDPSQSQSDHGNGDTEGQTLRCASEKEFIVMKGDYYYRGNKSAVAAAAGTNPFASAATASWWQRAFACVHRSPPGTDRGSRRVILSFDLADGDDDREWHDAHQKRKWRAGMTQRKSKLVA